ncbi:2-C-methyl-D-erythritol 4-phosphate cytidylyltransferase [Microbacterium thalli]|uniref:Bifunctional enzyme IspD/IspF n=1 Tax=Microbacterium thalli TaxID=3027921 RepID=A0ABT5SGH9_9MICO|nr:2-C-methyl-D-erythritol 4-phosphate cytidylyltransferase [Microbacterium thalli]MDD7961885.1 2-C-methyl-D-erythritol 4-phosphate cytidylyltransferase [Microbacterium thalli]MDN8549122.1 2-C-methyl-D-erythritol 4-phosphate cytidylyltransferase [Microbacterium thalli]
MNIIPVPRVAVIVVAAGSGTRLGASAPKAFVGIDEHSILRHALDGVASAPSAQVVVVVPAGREGDARTEAEAAFGDRSDLVSVVTGGETRQRSVAAGLAALWADVECVLVHDAARALTPPAVFARVIDEVMRSRAGVVPARPVVDTLKRVDGAVVTAAVDRSPLVAAQTPQGFPRELLATAYADAVDEHTDDAALFAAAGHRVRTVAGDDLSFKITTPADLDRARHLLTPSRAASVVPRIGTGTDVHAFGGDGPLRLAGLEWPGESGLSGHSDGDAVAHAIVDAVLAAAGLGDIGTHFGVDRPEYAGATGTVFLRRVRDLVAEAGYAIGNVSVQVQANRPRMAGRRVEAESVLSDALGAPVAVSATTTDGLGFTGAGDGVQATAVALVYPLR